jgi:uncharacterized protein with FMN-binding domain
MKNYLVLAVVAALLPAACMTLKSFAVYEPGRWTGRSEGYNGEIAVIVDTDTFSITDINVLKHDEDPIIGGGAITELKAAILETDSTDIDAVSGATLTSDGFIDAVEDALSKAKIKK